MTAAEIGIAAERYAQRLSVGNWPGNMTDAEARAAWRRLVDAPGSGWQQPVYAAMDPQDAYL